ncbi:glycosyltransferase family 2 protein [Paenibacillus alkalitolerans]|uniref:glycosyltransferase family 2 protein n=1 Tax=Paenibacillus alkalitolerans TaxID=2799335 RepID=UPI0018F47704|nr:glycosyltransferase family 2 protein [Paenibacillus alkalitolerans]
MDNYKITVITPSYNQERFIRRTINSVLKQGVENLEYLVFDGGSSDGTINILKSFDGAISYESQKDGGQANAVNKGLKRSRGEIIGWLNSDDVYYPNAIRSVLEVFDKYPEIEVIYGEADHIDEHDRFLEAYYTEDWNYERLKEVCFICQPAVFFRKSVIEKYGLLDETLNYCMDYEFWLRIGKYNPFFFLKQKLAGSRLHSETKTLKDRRLAHEEIVQMQKRKLGKVYPTWIYALAHVITEESGFTRETPKKNRAFVIHLVKQSVKLFFKHEKSIPLKELLKMIRWVVESWKSLRRSKRCE